MAVDKDIFTFRDAAKIAGPVAFATMPKPAGAACNLDCRYCYYRDTASQGGIMDDSLLESYIRQYIEADETGRVSFCWHGGEPLSAGIEFYRKAMELQRRYAAGKRVENSIQTNGTLVDEAWCEFFAENGFLVGISLDGPEDIHDACRRSRGGRPTFERVMRSIEMFRRNGVEYNTLSVVHRLCEGRGREIYGFLRDTAGSRYMQFLPAADCIAEDLDTAELAAASGRAVASSFPASADFVPASGSAASSNFAATAKGHPKSVAPDYAGARQADWSVSARRYGEFLCDVFDSWIVGDVGRYFVQIFDSTLAQWCGEQPADCTMNETCGDTLVVERNGDVYACDHFAYPEYRLGNIRETSLSEIYRSHRRLDFALAKRNSLPAECLQCRYYFACRGGCLKHRFDVAADGCRKNSLCEGMQLFFDHAAPYMDRMRRLLDARMSPALVCEYARERLR